MAWIEAQRLPLLASGLAMLALAAVLAGVDFRKRVNRAFAAVLALRGAAAILGSLGLGPSGDRTVQAFAPYLTLALVPLLLYFASLYPRRRGPLARPGMGWAVLAAVVALDLLYLAWHEGFYTLAPGPAPTPIQVARPGLHYAGFGPLALLGFGAFPLMAALGVLFVRDYARSPEGPQRTSYFLVAAGFLLNGVFDGSRQLVGLARLLQDPAGYPWAPWGWTFAVLPALSLLPALAGLAVVGVHQFRGRARERRLERRRERLLFALAALAAATGLSALLLPAGSEFFEHPATLVLLGVWRLTLPGFVSYALLRYALLDIDLKVRAALGWSVVAAIVGAAYFLVSESLEGVVADRLGDLGGLAAAGLLTLATGPLAKVGRRVAAFVMPGVSDTGAATGVQAHGLYRQQFLMLQEDGVLTPKERRSLADLAQRLGLSDREAERIERSALLGAGGLGPAGAAQPVAG